MDAFKTNLWWMYYLNGLQLTGISYPAAGLLATGYFDLARGRKRQEKRTEQIYLPDHGNLFPGVQEEHSGVRPEKNCLSGCAEGSVPPRTPGHLAERLWGVYVTYLKMQGQVRIKEAQSIVTAKTENITKMDTLRSMMRLKKTVHSVVERKR